MKDPRLLRIEHELRQCIPHMSEDCELARDIRVFGAERGIEHAARECLRRIDGLEAAKEASRRGYR